MERSATVTCRMRGICLLKRMGALLVDGVVTALENKNCQCWGALTHVYVLLQTHAKGSQCRFVRGSTDAACVSVVARACNSVLLS